LFSFTAGPEIRIRESSRWMARLLNVREAFQLRGYPRPVTASVSLKVVDPAFASNNEVLRLEVAGGSGSTSFCNRAGGEVDVTTLAALFTGWLSARDAIRCGGLRGVTPDEMEQLEAMFAGSKPWMMDRF
jgi:predicted acetyltransferase